MSDSDNQTENTEGLAEGVSSAPELPTGADQRLFLVVVDATEEMKVALRFACQRAKNTGGRVALFYVMEPADFCIGWRLVKRCVRSDVRKRREFCRGSPPT